MKLIFVFLLSLLFPLSAPQQTTPKDLTGAWEVQMQDGTRGLWIVDDQYFSITFYKKSAPEFISTEGGSWTLAPDSSLQLKWEYNTRDSSLVGQQRAFPIAFGNERLTFEDQEWSRLDDGTPGALQGAWLITGRMRDGEMTTMTPGARKTMKILSGTRFQWIAYNSETGDFFGTGGGTYTTHAGNYIEHIDFFSRDSTRVGASLEFDYELQDGKWHHSGKSSKGDPIQEIWSTRQSLGI